MSVLKELLGESPSSSNLGQQIVKVRRERGGISKRIIFGAKYIWWIPVIIFLGFV